MRREFVVTCPEAAGETVFRDLTKAMRAARDCKGKWVRRSFRE